MSLTIKLHYRVRSKLAGLRPGKLTVRQAKRVRILLELDNGYNVEETADRVGCGTATVKRVRRRFLDNGYEDAIYDRPIPGRPRDVTAREEKLIIATACSEPPDGGTRWTLRALAKETGRGYGTVRRVLERDGLKPWRKKNVVHRRAHGRVHQENE